MPASRTAALATGTILATLATASWAGAQSSPADSPAAPALGDVSHVGTVEFPTSCDPAVQAEFERGLALLHSFFYDEARRVFTEVADRDPECAIAHWGVAMTYYHPIWSPPDSSDLAAGMAAAERAVAAPKKNEREAEYIRAIEAYYQGIDLPEGAGGGDPAGVGAPAAALSCHGVAIADHTGRAACFLREMEGIATRHPEDVEAAAFYALSLLGNAPPGDPALVNQKRAGALLEQWYATHPDHPGLAHYIIHSYDYPPLAENGLGAAEHYAAIAPWVPHALHMPSHIFTRLGMWQKTIESNLASAAASRKYAALHHPDRASFEELHALDYLAYAYLQTGQDRKAKEVADYIASVDRTYPDVDFVAAYALGAIPARQVLERHQWKEAEALAVPPRAVWMKLPFAEAHLVYARAMGAALSGDVAAAIAAADRLGELSASIGDPRFRYFAEQTNIQEQAARGLIALAKGDQPAAIAMLTTAAAREDSLGKHPVSPGALLPVRELLGEALIEAGQPAAAQAAFEASLRIYPARFNGIWGAARAAERSGKKDVARTYYLELIELAKDGDGTRPELAVARAFVDKS